MGGFFMNRKLCAKKTQSLKMIKQQLLAFSF